MDSCFPQFTMLSDNKLAFSKDSFTPIGLHRIEWDGRDHQGRLVASGVYFLQARNKTGIVNKKLLLLR